ncbi:MAG: DUF1839 family protein [Betaproteobacteria bacterium]|nr:DUF1839 family protein [Betaproteobacteria bacterium]MBU6513886.1 DUF1839 family protein [Betaproteobacteria bacterium]
MHQVIALDPGTYRRHALHGPDRIWAETNCYTDVVIELLHGLGCEPSAALAFTLGVDFEGDEWTFFKFRDADLEQLYGWEVEELAPWRPLLEHVEEQLRQGRPVLVEMDSFYLPDTQGTAYRLAHVKSTVAVNRVDRDARRMGYFHNQGYHELGGEDFDAVFQPTQQVHERMLPPYIEYVKRRREPLRGPDLREASLGLLRRQLARLPDRNPFESFGPRFEADLAWLMHGDMETFHTYAFVTWRQFGACYELAHSYLDWLGGQGVPGLDDASRALREISETSKAYQFQLARAMARKRAPGLEVIARMAECWGSAMDSLRARYG